MVGKIKQAEGQERPREAKLPGTCLFVDDKNHPERGREREPIWHARDGWIGRCFVLQQLSDLEKLVFASDQVWSYINIIQYLLFILYIVKIHCTYNGHANAIEYDMHCLRAKGALLYMYCIPFQTVQNSKTGIKDSLDTNVHSVTGQ